MENTQMDGLLDNTGEFEDHERKYTSGSGCGVWRNDEIDQLIDLFEEKVFLWDIKHKDYHTKSKRAAAIREIATMLGKSTGDVLKKWQNLRSYFSREYLKLKKSKSETGDQDDIRGSKWVYYERLVFLKDQIVPRTRPIPSSDSSEGEDCDDDEESADESKSKLHESLKRKGGDIVGSIRPVKRSTQSLSYGTRSSLNHNHTNSAGLSASNPHISSPAPAATQKSSIIQFPKPRRDEDADDVYGRHIANELRRIPDSRAKELAKVKIQNILYEAHYGQTTETPFISSSAIPQTLASFAHYLMTMQNTQLPNRIPPNTADTSSQNNTASQPESPAVKDASSEAMHKLNTIQELHTHFNKTDNHNSHGDISTDTGHPSF